MGTPDGLEDIVQSETGSKSLTDEQRNGYLENLNAETLSALMRSTWTWDDRPCGAG